MLIVYPDIGVRFKYNENKNSIERVLYVKKKMSASVGGSSSSIKKNNNERTTVNSRRFFNAERLAVTSRILFEYAPDAYFLTDLKGNFVNVNRACEKISGFSKKELAGQNFRTLRLLPPDQVAKASKILKMSALRKPTGPDELALRRKNSTIVPVEIRTYPVKIQSRILVLGIARDITERKKTEQVILRSNMFNSALVENAPFGIMTIDKRGMVDYVNPAMLMISGGTKVNYSEMNAFTLRTYVQIGLPEKIKKCFGGRSFFMGPLNYISHFSRTRTVRNFTGIPMRNETGKIEKVMLFVEDITKIKEAEEKIRESEEKFRSIVENSSDQIFMLDKDYKFLSVNKTAAGLSRKSSEEMIGRSIFEIFPETIASSFSKNIKRVFDTGEGMSIEDKMVVKGRELYNSSSLNPVRDYKGKVVAVTGIVRDITEKKKTEKEINRRSEELEKFNRLAIGRELKMIELKKRIRELEQGLIKKRRKCGY